jgi:hypothetical protein
MSSGSAVAALWVGGAGCEVCVLLRGGVSMAEAMMDGGGANWMLRLGCRRAAPGPGLCECEELGAALLAR